MKKAREIQAQKLEAKENDKKRKVNEITRERHVLHEKIDQLPDTEVETAQKLLDKLCCPRGFQNGQILSPCLQDKATQTDTNGQIDKESLQD